VEINAQLVKELREKSGAGLMECKKALQETSGDPNKAIKYLKEKGIMKATEKSGRTTKEGIISIAISKDNGQGVVVELNCETDFVARTDEYQSASQEIAENILKSNVEDVKSIPSQIHDQVKNLIAKLGENISINQIARIKKSANGFLSSYIHQGGKIGVLLHLEVGNAQTQSNIDFNNLAKDISMHIAAMSPIGISKDDVDSNTIKEQEEIFTKQAKDSGKPDNVIEKIVAGKVAQFYKEIVLLEQAFVKEPKISVQKYIDLESKKFNDKIKVVSFIRLRVGE